MNWSTLSEPLFRIGEAPITPLRVGAALLVIAAALLGAWAVRGGLSRGLQALPVNRKEGETLIKVIHVAVLVFGAIAALNVLGLSVHAPLLQIGEVSLSILSVVTFLAFVVGVQLVASILGRLVQKRVLSSRLDGGVRYAIGRMSYYVLLVIGWTAALQTIGVQLSSLTVILGALSVGIGFGLQNIVNNFVSGLILLMERPMKVGDWVDVDGTTGRVKSIGARSTTILTRDNIAIIIPNADCISNKLINWSYGDPQTRLRIAVSVAAESDLEVVEAALLEVARQHPSVLKEPEARVYLREFGDSSVDLQLLVWVDIGRTPPARLKSDLYFAIGRAFREKGIQAPTPLREMRVVQVPRGLEGDRLPLLFPGARLGHSI